MASTDFTVITSLEGQIADVISSNAGSSLTVDALLGDLTLFIDDASSFDENGGQLKLNDEVGTVLNYDTCDKDLNTISLSAPLAIAQFEGAIIQVYPTATERWATVTIPGYADPLIAVVPYSIAAQLPLGTRKVGAAETVLVTQDPNGWVVVDVLVDPIFDGTFIQPGTVPTTTFTSDGVPPSSSPTPIIEGGIGYIFIKWTGITNHDPVTYEVHISLTNGFVPDSTTLSGRTTSEFFFIKAMPDASTLTYLNIDGSQTVYYIRLISTDIDGAAAAGTQQSGSMVQASGPDLAVGSITAFSAIIDTGAIGTLEVGSLSADKIASGNLSGSLVLGGSIIAPATAGTVPGPGNTGMIIDAQGIRTYDALGHLGVNIPSDGTSPFIAGASFDVTSLTIRDGFSYQDSNGHMEIGSELILQSGVTPPGPPSLSGTWVKTPLSWPDAFGHIGHINGVDAISYDAHGGPLGDTPVFYTLTWTTDSITAGGVKYTSPLYVTEHRADDGTLNRWNNESIDQRLDLMAEALTSKSDFIDYGITRVGAYLFVLVDYHTTGGAYAARWIRYNQSDLSYSGTGRVTADIPSGGFIQWITCSDPTNSGSNAPAIVYGDVNSNAVIKIYTDTTLVAIASSHTYTGGLNSTTESVWGAEWDGSNWWLMFANNNGALANVQKFIGGTRLYSSGHDFTNVATPGRGYMFGGISLDPATGTFYSCNSTTIFMHSTKEWAAAGSSPWWVAASWTDGTHETTVGIRAHITVGNRVFIAVTVDTLSLGVTGANVYMQQAASDPDVTSLGNMRQQAFAIVASTLLSAFNTVGATDPLLGSFPPSTPATIGDVGSTWSLGGDGTVKLPFHGATAFMSVSQNVANGNDNALTFGDVDYDTDGYWDSLHPTRLTVPVGLDGWYLISGIIDFGNPAGTSGWVASRLYKNGVTIIGDGQYPVTGSSMEVPTPTIIRQLVAGDYVELNLRNASGASATGNPGDGHTQLSLYLLALS